MKADNATGLGGHVTNGDSFTLHSSVPPGSAPANESDCSVELVGVAVGLTRVTVGAAGAVESMIQVRLDSGVVCAPFKPRTVKE
jgi:hypothetical protein